MPKRGDFVWGKMRSFPWWPAIIIDPNDCGRDTVTKNNFWVFWFHDHKITEIERGNILDFKQHFSEKYNAKIGKSLKQAIEEVLIILAVRHRIKFSNPFSLFEWATKGFHTKVPASFVESNSSELPTVVLKFLQGRQFKRSYESESDSEDYVEKEITNTLNSITRGLKTLEDICIMCCKSNKIVFKKHPLFIGGVCRDCKKNFLRIEAGKIKDICVVCGQGGTLVLCSLSNCLRAYCRACIDYMTVKGSYPQILKDDNWRCYFCEPVHNPLCFIRRRENYHSIVVNLPDVPKEKLPIRVIASTDAALSIFKKKKIEVAVYRTEPTKEPEHVKGKRKIKECDDYRDFDKEEFAEIRPDFIYGSFFISSTSPTDNRKKRLDAFAAAFYRFLFRLNNAKLCNTFVFYIFLSDGNFLDADVMSHVMQFLMVDPVKIELSSKHFYLWSNMPAVKNLENNTYPMKEKEDNNNIEEDILNTFLDPLKEYFKQA
ncbi:hypothetical protein NPIL_332731 [Nephila pilipes]|uniref:DNA (cytosine-5-)-methyltransferase n=1 Tax=Nephila pilipes TaxID=299642 RepID=A0A8X6PY71_NEPPI|nr:hypothetical protein NPIL_332731 [Nephila pilipes]